MGRFLDPSLNVSAVGAHGKLVLGCDLLGILIVDAVKHHP